MRKIIVFLSVFVISAFVANTCFAGLINYDRRNKTESTTTSRATTSSYQKPAAAQPEPSTVKPSTVQASTTTPSTAASSTALSMNSDKSASSAMPAWMKTPPRVKTLDEKKFDANKDGILQATETSMMLKDAISMINSKGSVSASSDILKPYDSNGDGTISRYEALSISADLGK